MIGRRLFLVYFCAASLAGCSSVAIDSGSIDNKAAVVEAGRKASDKNTDSKKPNHVNDLSSLNGEVKSDADQGYVNPEALIVEVHSRDESISDLSELDESNSEIVNQKASSELDTETKKNTTVYNTVSRGVAPPVRKKSSQTKSSGNAASKSLLKSSSRMLDEKQYRLAVNHAERALRVSPRNPHAYYQLALIYKKQSNFRQSLHFVEKGLSQNGVSPSLRKSLNSLKAECQDALDK